MIWLFLPAMATPYVWTPRTPAGELDPGTTTVRLVQEVLDLQILDHNEVQVRADYILDNPGEKTVLRFAVPITSGGTNGGRASSAAASVRLTDAQGEFVPCLVRPATNPRSLELSMRSGGDRLTGSCTADVVIGPGVSRLRMSYEGELFYESHLAPPSIPVSDRTLVYDLAGAANWAGVPEQLDVTVSLGQFADTTSTIEPANVTRDGGLLSWSFAQPDHRALGRIRVKLGGRVADTAHALGHAHDPSHPVKQQAVLSDGNATTTWCGPATRLQPAEALGCGPGLWVTPAVDLDVVACETETSLVVSKYAQPGGVGVVLSEGGDCFEVRPTGGACLSELALRPNVCPKLPEPTEPAPE